jgi:hypothetical protein
VQAPQIDSLGQFLTPNPTDREVVVLSDNEMSCSIMVSRSHTVAMSGEATSLVHSALFGAVPARLRDLVREQPGRLETVLPWINGTIEEGMFGLSQEAPKRTIAPPTAIEANAHIAVTDFGEGRGVPVEYPGTVTRAQINRTTMYWYAAGVSLREKKLISAIGYEGSVTTQGPLGIGLLPRPVGGGLGVNCNGCKTCAVCAACAGCGLCGGVDLAAGVIGVDGVLGVIGLAGSVTAFESLRSRQ